MNCPYKTLAKLFNHFYQFSLSPSPTVQHDLVPVSTRGSGSSRDWAAKGPRLLGVKAAIVESYERIHRSNLIGMGIIPLQFKAGENAESLGLTGFESYEVTGIADGLKVGKELSVRAQSDDGKVKEFKVTCRIDTPAELDYYSHGGILEFVLRQLLKGSV